MKNPTEQEIYEELTPVGVAAVRDLREQHHMGRNNPAKIPTGLSFLLSDLAAFYYPEGKLNQ